MEICGNVGLKQPQRLGLSLLSALKHRCDTIIVLMKVQSQRSCSWHYSLFQKCYNCALLFSLLIELVMKIMTVIMVITIILDDITSYHNNSNSTNNNNNNNTDDKAIIVLIIILRILLEVVLIKTIRMTTILLIPLLMTAKQKQRQHNNNGSCQHRPRYQEPMHQEESLLLWNSREEGALPSAFARCTSRAGHRGPLQSTIPVDYASSAFCRKHSQHV